MPGRPPPSAPKAVSNALRLSGSSGRLSKRSPVVSRKRSAQAASACAAQLPKAWLDRGVLSDFCRDRLRREQHALDVVEGVSVLERRNEVTGRLERNACSGALHGFGARHGRVRTASIVCR